MKLKFKVLFKNGKTKVYKSSHEKDCDKIFVKMMETTMDALHRDLNGRLKVKNDVIRYNDISAIQIKKVWF
jgi:hypothetical protein